MELFVDHDHFADLDHCGWLPDDSAGSSSGLRGLGSGSDGGPTDHTVPTTKISTSGPSRCGTCLHSARFLLRVGQVPAAALAIAAADCQVLRDGHHARTVGGDAVEVWRLQARRAGHSGLLELARAWQVSIETGAPMSTTLDQVAASLAADQALTRVVNGELATARATGKVMAVLPGCGIGIGYLLGGDPARWLLSGPAGWACLLSGVLLACAGVLWIEALARQASGEA